MNMEAKSAWYQALLREHRWIDALFVPMLAMGFYSLGEYLRLRKPEAQAATVRLRAWRFRIAASAWLAVPMLPRALSGRALLDGEGINRLPEAIVIVVVLGFLIAWIGGGWYLFHRAHVIMKAGVADVRASDERGPVVLFRSFKDDDALVGRAFANAEADPADPGSTMRKFQSGDLVGFEDMIERQVRDYGQLIAVGKPGESRREGAVRDYFPTHEWRPAVLEWMDTAQLIVVIASCTAGLRWELMSVVTRQHMNRLILLVPPGPRREERWSFVCECFAWTPWCHRLAQAEHESVLAVHWNAAGELIFLCSEHRQDRDYEIALHLAIYGILSSGWLHTGSY